MDNSSTEKTKHNSSLNPWLLLLLTFATPISGWRKLKASTLSGNEFASRIFYPLIALTSLSEFATLIYFPTPLQTMLVEAIISFASWFFSYFVIQMMFRVFFKGETLEALTNAFGQKFCMVTLSTLCLYMIMYNFVPMLESILVFFPLYTIYLIFKGLPTLLMPRMRTRRTVVFVVGLNIMIPFGLYYMLRWLLQNAMVA